MKGTKSTLGSTELANVSVCDRLSWLVDIMGYSTNETKEARLLGTLIHVLLKFYYAQFLEVRPAWFFEKGQYEALNEEGNGHATLIEKAKQIYGVYIAQWGGTDRAWKVLSVEEEVLVRVGDMFGIPEHWSDEQKTEVATRLGLFGPYIGATLADLETKVSKQSDLMVEREDGNQFEIDYKSTAGKNGKLVRWTERNTYKHNWQQLEYEFLGKFARRPDGTLLYPRYDCIIIQRMQTIPPFPCDRNFVRPPRAAFAEMPLMILRQVARRRRLRTLVAEQPGVMPLGSPWECFRGGAPCDGYEMCCSEDRWAALAANYTRTER